jgi:endoglucanase
VFVSYAIPDRDCGGYSAGGCPDVAHLTWNRTIADSLRGHPAIVLIEPDSIAIPGDYRCIAQRCRVEGHLVHSDRCGPR